jgi:UDP-N-acetylmuramoylalanine--D-glutamate ligase
MQYTHAHIAILGAGESGVGAALLAQRMGNMVWLSDRGLIRESYKTELEENQIPFEEGGHTLDKILCADVIIKSPGIPNNIPLLVEARAKQIPIISEIEFAWYYTRAKIIGITGSNGKTTTSLLTHHIFKRAGIDVGLAGNVGVSFARQVAEGDKQWYVLELSSFQLEDVVAFRPNIAVILNISPDHLDRYEHDMNMYVDAKFKIVKNMTEEDWLIYNADDTMIVQAVNRHHPKAKTAPFSSSKEIEIGGYISNNQLIVNIKDQFTMSIYDLGLKGKHNAQNSLASSIASRIADIRKDVIRESLADFENVEHRLEFVARVNGIEFINDSKATNVNATWYALECMEKPTVWIVGGVDKGNDYSELMDLVKQKVKAIICLGKDNAKIIKSFSDVVDTIVEAGSAAEAVAFGYRLASKGETVLLSPACASFDLFENYEDRGNQFKQAVRSL